MLAATPPRTSTPGVAPRALPSALPPRALGAEELPPRRRRLVTGLVIGLLFALLSPVVPRNALGFEAFWFVAHGFGVAAYGGLLCSGWQAPLPSPHAWAFMLLGFTHMIWSIIVGAILAFVASGFLAIALDGGPSGGGFDLEAFPVLATGLIFSIVVWTGTSLRCLFVMLGATALAGFFAWSNAWWPSLPRPFERLGLAAAPLHLAITLSLYFEARKRLAHHERLVHGMCLACGYDLRTIDSLLCPECGASRGARALGAR